MSATELKWTKRIAFVGLMFLAVVLICLLPGIATALPDAVMSAVPAAR